MHWAISNDRAFPFLAAGTGLATLIAAFSGFGLEWWMVGLLGHFLYGCLGVTVTFHRYLTHRSYLHRWPWLVYLFSFFGAMGGTGSSVGWVMVHRMHHRYADKEGDPHSPHSEGFWKLFLNQYQVDFNKWTVRDLLNDSFHLALHHYYFLIISAWWLGLALVDYRLCLFLGMVGMFLTLLSSATSVYLEHIVGDRPHPTRDDSRNHWFNAAYAWGEGWHNNHHYRPYRWYFGENWKQIDISGLIIWLLRDPKLTKIPMFPREGNAKPI